MLGYERPATDPTDFLEVMCGVAESFRPCCDAISCGSTCLPRQETAGDPDAHRQHRRYGYADLHLNQRMRISAAGIAGPDARRTSGTMPRCWARLTPPSCGAAPACTLPQSCSRPVLGVQSAATASRQQRCRQSASTERTQQSWRCRARRADVQEEEDVVADAWSEEVTACKCLLATPALYHEAGIEIRCVTVCVNPVFGHHCRSYRRNWKAKRTPRTRRRPRTAPCRPRARAGQRWARHRFQHTARRHRSRTAGPEMCRFSAVFAMLAKAASTIDSTLCFTRAPW